MINANGIVRKLRNHSLLRVAEGGDHERERKRVPRKGKNPEQNASAKLTRAKLNKRSGYADLPRDKSGPESPPEFWRSWCVEGHARSVVISSVLTQRYLKTIRQRYSSCEGPPSLE
ncbi:hypothetical protein Tco_1264754 [Tanacetum coccineum]